MINLGRWASGTAMSVLALLGLVITSRAVDPMFGFFGAMLFLFGIAIVIALVHLGTAVAPALPGDRQDPGQQSGRHEA